jgi:hypothetical protein
MAAVPAILAIAGTGAQVAGSIVGGNARARAAEEGAKLKKLQADEVLKRSEINIRALQRQKRQLTGRQVSSFAKAGVDFSGSAIEVLDATEDQFKRDILSARREAAFKADQLRRGADIDTRLASDARAAGIISGVSTGLSGGVRGLTAAGVFDKAGKPDELKLGIDDDDIVTGVGIGSERKFRSFA